MDQRRLSGLSRPLDPRRGQATRPDLATLAELDFDLSQVMGIAPFRDIARHIRRLADRYPGLVAGTIHTAQGKQADIVIVVLGSDPQRHGARRWATYRHFNVLAHRLPSSPPR